MHSVKYSLNTRAPIANSGSSPALGPLASANQFEALEFLSNDGSHLSKAILAISASDKRI